MSPSSSRPCAADVHEARNERVLACRHLVEPLVRRYASGTVAREDLRQVAYLALVQAADRFDPDRGHPFEAFARVTVEGGLKRYLRDSTWIVRPPRGLQDLLLRVRASRGRLVQDLGREPSTRDVAADLGIGSDLVIEALVAAEARDAATAAPSARREAPAQASDRWLRSVESGYDRAEALIVLHDAIARLDDRERELLRLRYVENLSQRRISELIGLSQPYVSRVIASVLARLRRVLDEVGPD